MLTPRLLDEPVVGGHHAHNEAQQLGGTADAATAAAAATRPPLYQESPVNQCLGGQVGTAEEVTEGGQKLGREVGDAGGQEKVLGQQVYQGQYQHLPHCQGELVAVQQQPGERVACT